MEHLNIQESVVNCPICRNSGIRRQTYFSKYFTKEFSRGMYHMCQHKYMPSVSPVESLENLIKNQKIIQKYTSSKDGYEQIYRRSLMASAKKSNYKLKKHRPKKPVIYQVYTLTTDNEKPKRKPPRTVYNYPYSSSSSETSTSLIGKRKKSITMHPSTKKGSDDEDSDSECCQKFPITEKHYRHIVDGVECSSNHNRSSFSRKKPKEDVKIKNKNKVTKRADFDFNQINMKQSNRSNQHAGHVKTKKKCKCKSKCKHSLDEDRSDSVLSEKTFAKFINSLHTYVNKTKKLNSHKYQKKRVDSDSTCSLCQHEESLMKKKKLCKDHDCKKHQREHHSHQQQQTRRSRPETEDIFKKYLQKF